MNETALRRLIDAQNALRTALDGHDVTALENAAHTLAEAVGVMRATDAWRDHPDLRRDLTQALKDADAVRGHINALADRNRRQLDRLIALAGIPRAQAYGRNGRLS